MSRSVRICAAEAVREQRLGNQAAGEDHERDDDEGKAEIIERICVAGNPVLHAEQGDRDR